MRNSGRGYIVNVASLAGLIGTFGYTDYCASKFGVIGFSEALRSELKPHGIAVSVLCPPDTDTPGFATENRTKPEETRAVSGHTRVMHPDAVAGALLRGMQRRDFLIVPGIESKCAALLKRLAPSAVQWVMDRTIARVTPARVGRSPAPPSSVAGGKNHCSGQPLRDAYRPTTRQS
jgi:short-subunit dehydrogenase